MRVGEGVSTGIYVFRRDRDCNVERERRELWWVSGVCCHCVRCMSCVVVAEVSVFVSWNSWMDWIFV
jgi:hypothetical protein